MGSGGSAMTRVARSVRVAGSVEACEARTLFAAGPAAVTASVLDGALVVVGTRKADAIYVGPGPTPGAIAVRCGAALKLVGLFDSATFADVDRSEERRVGKECRSRW